MFDAHQARSELSDFKRDVNLVQYARSVGYEVVRHKSSAASKCLKHGTTGDKIIVARDRRDDHWIYRSLKVDRDSGTIVDFVQNRVQPMPDLSQLRAILREWLGRAAPMPIGPHDHVEASERDRIAAAAQFMACEPACNLRALNERGLRAKTLLHPQFAPTWRRDPKTGNALFVHRDAAGISGFEQKNRGFTGFAKGGQKTLWYSELQGPVERLVVAESAIDALSYFQLRGCTAKPTRFVSVAGQTSSLQLELLARAAAKLPAGGEIVLAVDADAAGQKLYERIRGALPHATLAVRRDSPEVANCKDWNDVLKHQERAFIAELQLRRPSQPSRGPQRGSQDGLER